MRKLLLMMFALLGTVGAWASVQTTYVVTKMNGTCYILGADGSFTDSNRSGFGSKFVSSDEILTCASENNTINWGFNTNNGFRIRHENGISVDPKPTGNSIVAYTISVPENYEIVSYTFAAAPNGVDDGKGIKISDTNDMANATTVAKSTGNSYTKTVNNPKAVFYLQHANGDNPIDVTLSVVVESPLTPEEGVRAYLTDDKIANINKAGEYGYPKTTTQTYQNIKAIVDKLNDTPDALTEEDYQNVETYYNAYLAETDIIVPETGKFYRMYAVNAAGNKYLFASDNMIKGRRIQDPSTLSGDASFIWYLSEDNTLTALSSGLQYAGTTDNINVIECAGGTTVEFVKSSATSFGLVSIRSNGGLWFIQASAAGESDLIKDTSGASYAGAQFFVEEVTTLPISIAEVEDCATLWSPVALSIPDGVTAYTGVDNEDCLNLIELEGGIIPAETAVVLQGEAGSSYDFVVTTGGTPVTDNALKGGLGLATPGSILTLQKPEETGVRGFYTYDDENGLPGFKAYLLDEASQGSKGIEFGGTSTGIATVEGAATESSAIYNLAGQRVEKAVKGVYIVNGKKVLVK